MALFAAQEERGRRSRRPRQRFDEDPWVRAALRLFNAGRPRTPGDVDAMRTDAARCALRAVRRGRRPLGPGDSLFLDYRAADAGRRPRAAPSRRSTRRSRAAGRASMPQRRGADVDCGSPTCSCGWAGSTRPAARAASSSAARPAAVRTPLHAGDARGASPVAGAATRAGRAAPTRRERLAPPECSAGIPAAQGHVTALVAGRSSALRGRGGRPRRGRVRSAGLPVAVATEDMPIVATFGVAAAAIAAAAGRAEDGGRLLGAAAGSAAADDPTDRDGRRRCADEARSAALCTAGFGRLHARYGLAAPRGDRLAGPGQARRP